MCKHILNASNMGLSKLHSPYGVCVSVLCNKSSPNPVGFCCSSLLGFSLVCMFVVVVECVYVC